MSDFSAFVALGFRHIAGVDGLDHIVFLLALAAIYRWHDWRDAIWVVTSFTVGHSITLALAALNLLALPGAWIEFLIPVTIVATCVENLLVRDARPSSRRGRDRPVLAGVFGLVHGAGFANYLRGLFMDDIALPLLGFNVGIEVGQLAVLAVIAGLLAVLDRLLAAVPAVRGRSSPLRVRVTGVSLAVGALAVTWAVQRIPVGP